MPKSNRDPIVDSGGVVAGFFAFTEITEPSAHRAYNEWHQLDHLPEQLPIPGISHGQRWVSSPRCRDVSYSSASGCSPKPFSPDAFFSFHFFTQASQLAPAARSLPVKFSAAISL